MRRIRSGAWIAIVIGLLLILVGATDTGGAVVFWAFWVVMATFGLDWLARKDR